MSSAVDQQLIYLNGHGHGEVTCPACMKNLQICATTYRNLRTPIWIRCACDYKFFILLNTKDFYRKDVWLPGVYAKLGSPITQEMIIANLSLSGIHFNTIRFHELQVNGLITISFYLDAQQKNEIHMNSIVKWISNRQIGLEFCNAQDHKNEIELYLNS